MGITAIIPCYNAAKTIGVAVNSLLLQTLPPKEIIIIDDGSDQKTKEAISVLDHPTIKVITQKNQGVCIARNIGIQQAQYNFIVTLDADDSIADTFLEKTYNAIQKNLALGGVCCWYNYIYENKIIMKGKPQGGGLKDFLYENHATSAALFRKEALLSVGGYDQNMKLGFEDWDLWIALLKKGWAIKVVEEYLYNYSNTPNSRNKNALKNEVEIKRYLFEKYRDDYLENYDKTVAHLLYQLERHQKHAKKIEMGLEYTLGQNLLRPLRWLKRKF